MIQIPFYSLEPKSENVRTLLETTAQSVVASRNYILGERLAAFESEFAAYLGSNYFLGVGNGLDAIEIALRTANVGLGDEVIVPGFTFHATWLAVAKVGATPIPVDVDLETGCINVSAVLNAISSTTKAIVPVHLFGGAANVDAISTAIEGTGIALIEDCAQAHGAKIGSQHVGTFGDFGAFSFYPTKNLGAYGDGGGIATNSTDSARFIESFRSYGKGESKYEHKILGTNSRLDELQAAILSVKLTALEDDNLFRKKIASRYLDALGDKSNAVINFNRKDESVWHHFVINSTNRDKIRDVLSGFGVATDIHYPYSFGSVPALTQYMTPYSMPNAVNLSKSVLSLPIGPWMAEHQYEYVSEIIGLPQVKNLLKG